MMYSLTFSQTGQTITAGSQFGLFGELITSSAKVRDEMMPDAFKARRDCDAWTTRNAACP